MFDLALTNNNISLDYFAILRLVRALVLNLLCILRNIFGSNDHLIFFWFLNSFSCLLTVWSIMSWFIVLRMLNFGLTCRLLLNLCRNLLDALNLWIQNDVVLPVCKLRLFYFLLFSKDIDIPIVDFAEVSWSIVASHVNSADATEKNFTSLYSINSELVISNFDIGLSFCLARCNNFCLEKLTLVCLHQNHHSNYQNER